VKGAERHRLKDNELAALALRAQRSVEGRSKELLGVGIGAAVIVASVIGYFAWRSGVEDRASGALSTAMAVLEEPVGTASPQGPAPRFATERERNEAALTRFKTVADDYSSTDAGILARYREGAALVALGRSAEAITAFQQVVDEAGSAPVGQMARLGLAEAHEQAGQHDEAISAYQEVVAGASGAIPVEGVLMQLARAYRSAGRPEDARQTFTRVVEEFGTSPFRGEAERELDLLDDES
jgi:tetratricopeptide (TPR) repeat protein